MHTYKTGTYGRLILYSGGTDFFEKFTAEFSALAPVYKTPPPWAQKFHTPLLKFRRVTIRGAQPSTRLSEEICLSEASAGVSERVLRGFPRVSQPKGPFRTVFSTESDSVVFYYSVVNLLRVVVHYSKHSKSLLKM